MDRVGRARCWVSEGTDMSLDLRDAGPGKAPGSGV